MVDQALLMIADIGGYTQYMRLHRMSLAHSQEITGRLLDAMVRAVPGLELVEVEGDAAFLYAPVANSARSPVAEVAQFALSMHQAFHSQQDRMVALDMCSCPGCVEAGRLHVKFVAHVGEVALQTIGRHTQLVGVDVIAVHRMLKNSVPIREYVLMTEPIYAQSPPPFRDAVSEVEDNLEGLGRTTLYYVDLQPLALPPSPAPTPTFARRVRETTGVVLHGMPKMFGKQANRATVEA
jgi:hypothetical protein